MTSAVACRGEVAAMRAGILKRRRQAPALSVPKCNSQVPTSSSLPCQFKLRDVVMGDLNRSPRYFSARMLSNMIPLKTEQRTRHLTHTLHCLYCPRSVCEGVSCCGNYCMGNLPRRDSELGPSCSIGEGNCLLCAENCPSSLLTAAPGFWPTRAPPAGDQPIGQ